MNTVVADGSFENGVSWSLTLGGTLTVSGSGEVPVFAGASGAPWYSYRSQITKIVVGKDITKLGAFAFYGCANAAAVEFEEGSQLVTVDRYAFARCSSLTEITLPERVRTLGYAAFQVINGLVNVYLPDVVSNISASAFMDCPNVVLSVAAGSYAERWAVDHSVAYIVRVPETSEEPAPEAEETIVPELVAEPLPEITEEPAAE